MDTQMGIGKFMLRVRLESRNSRREQFATNSPQAQSDSNVQSRISAGYSGADFGGKNGPEGPFLSIVFGQVIDLKVVGATGFEPATSCSRSNENAL